MRQYKESELETALRQLDFLRDALDSNPAQARALDIAAYYIEKAILEGR